MSDLALYTIGVYGSTETSFFKKLEQNNIDTFCDIRQTRGVRGSKYRYVNSLYLQEKLKTMGIAYHYVKALAPTNEIRSMQHADDFAKGVVKKDRTTLGTAFIHAYQSLILQPFDCEALLADLKAAHAQNVVFFCIEEWPEACHRSLVATELQQNFHLKLKHL